MVSPKLARCLFIDTFLCCTIVSTPASDNQRCHDSVKWRRVNYFNAVSGAFPTRTGKGGEDKCWEMYRTQCHNRGLSNVCLVRQMDEQLWLLTAEVEALIYVYIKSFVTIGPQVSYRTDITAVHQHRYRTAGGWVLQVCPGILHG